MTAPDEMAQAKNTALRLEAEHAAALAARWQTTWDQLQPEYEELLTDLLGAKADDTGWVSPRLMRGSRLEQALEHTRELLRGVTQVDIDAADEYTLPIVQSMVDGNTRAITAQLPPQHAGVVVQWDRMNTKALDAIFERTTQQITARSWSLADDVTQVIRQELTRGVVVGDNPRTTARRMTKRTGDQVNWGRNRALNISRTEMLDASRAAQEANDRANKDVIRGWQWMCTLGSNRTCIACAVMHGTFHHPTDPGPEGHPSCRCARVPVTKSWADLGIPGMDDDPLPIDPTAGQTWFDNLTPDAQATVMGSAARLQAYNSGALTWNNLVIRKQNPEWRPSYIPTPMAKTTPRPRRKEVRAA